MSLGTKIILLFVCLLVVHSFFNYGVQKLVEEPTYSHTEKKMMLRELEWFSNTLNNEASDIGLMCKNLAEHNGIYEYVLGQSDDFKASELDGGMCSLLEINIVVILDNDNNVVYSNILGENFVDPIKLDGFSVSQWSDGHPLLGFENACTLKKGLLKVHQNIIVAASVPIHNPKKYSEKSGTLVLGRLLTDSYLKKLTEVQGLSAGVVSVSEAGFREGQKIVDGFFYSENAGNDYTVLLAINDVAGKPSLAIKALISSSIASKTRNANRLGLIAEMCFAVVSLMIMLFLVYNVMGKRLEKLIDHIIGIRHSGVLVKIVQESGGDEIDLLAYEFNQMVVRVQRDIELRTQVETELKRSLSELERFADVASHDLQEPLRSVASCLQLLEMQYKDTIDDDGKQLIEYAVQGSRRMKTLIKALLAYSDIGTTALEVATCDCNNVLAEAVVELKEVIGGSNAEIICDKLPCIRADKSRLLLLFTNIIENAVNYTADGSKPIVKIECKEIDKTWRFSITDNGIGIDKAYYTQIFIAFKRLHTQQEYQGSGIGLAICRRIIEQHSGRIWVKSELGKGSIFYFSIPV